MHSFDPTTRLLPQHAAHKQAGVTFHPYGLRGDCRVAGRENLSFYGAMRGEMHTLAQMVRRLGHERRPLRVLKVDCEGCEWDAFHQLSAAHLGRLSALLSRVELLMLELHFGGETFKSMPACGSNP